MMLTLIKCVQTPMGNWPSQFTGPNLLNCCHHLVFNQS